MISFKDFITESTKYGETHHLTVTRMASGPTDAHLDLGNTVKDSAEEDGASHEVMLTRSHDAKKNPLPPNVKLKHAKRAMAGSGVNVGLMSKDKPDFISHAAHLYRNGVKHLVFHHGSDEANMANTLKKYNGHGDPESPKYYKFDSVEGRQLGGEREEPKNENDVRKSTLSGSRLRKAAAEGKKDLFKKMAASTLSDKHKEEMYNDNRKGLGVDD